MAPERARRQVGPLLAGLALLAVPQGALHGQDAGAAASRVVERVLQAYGGREALSGVRSFRLEGVVDAHPRKQRGVFVRILEGPDHLKLLIRYPDVSEIRVLMGEQAFAGDSPETMAPAAGPLAGALRLQAARSMVPWILMAMEGRLRLGDGTPPRILLQGDLAPGLSLTFHVDRETHRIVRSESLVAMGGGSIPFSTDYADFREVGGILFAHREETRASGVHTASVEVLRVALNPVGDALRLPAGVR